MSSETRHSEARGGPGFRRALSAAFSSATVLLALGLGVAFPPAGLAQGSPLAAANGPFDLVRAVDRAGDPAVLDLLASGAPADRLAAVRGAPFLRSPELALTTLAKLAAGSDPWLAPAAARSCLTIARRLTVDALRNRERSATVLRPALERLRALAETSSARADLRSMAMQAVELLTRLFD